MKRRLNGQGSLLKRRGVYYLKMFVGGKELRFSLHTTIKEEAEQAAREITRGYDLSKEERLAAIKVALEPKRESVTIESAWNCYMQAPENIEMSDGAAEVDFGRWRNFVRWLHGYDGGVRCRVNQRAAFPDVKTLAEVTDSVAAIYIREMRRKTSPATINKYVRVYKRIWRLCGEPSTPWDRIPRAKVNAHLRRALDEGEVRCLIDAASGELRTLFVIGAYTGLRMGDCARLSWDCIDLTGNTLRIQPHKTAHTSAARVCVPIHPDLRAALLGAAMPHRGAVLKETSAWPEWKVSDAVQAHFAKCGLAESAAHDGYRRKVATVGFHSLRSTFVSMMANAGAPLAMVQSIVGHMSPEMTQHYYRQDENAMRGFIERLPRVV